METEVITGRLTAAPEGKPEHLMKANSARCPPRGEEGPDQWGSYLKTWQRIPAQVLREASICATGDRLFLGQAALQPQITAPRQCAQLPHPPSLLAGQEQLPWAWAWAWASG